MSSSPRVVDFFDSPEQLDTSVTPIPAKAAAPLEVVNSLADSVHSIRVIDGILSTAIGVYSGPSGSEKLETIIGGSSGLTAIVHLGKGMRISLRSMDTAITSGVLNFIFQGNQ